MNEQELRNALVKRLRTENTSDPSGQWSVWDLMNATGLGEDEVRAVLEELRPLTGGGRYVGGTSGQLYSI